MASATNATAAAKVAVLGASGGIGQPMSMLLKLSPLVDELSCYDIVGTPGVAADLSHIPTRAPVTGYLPSAGSWPPTSNTGLAQALKGASVVVISAGVPPTTGMTRDDLFNINAGIMKTLAEACADHCPGAVIAVVSNPVNSIVPITAEVLKAKGVHDHRKVIGVTQLDVVRANAFAAEHMGKDPTKVHVPVICGHAGPACPFSTIVPLWSQVPGLVATDEQLEAMTKRVQFSGDDIIAAKAGSGSATLSMAYAGCLFTEYILKGLKGEAVTACAFVESNLTEASYFASPCKLGPNGVEEVLPFGEISAFEKRLVEKMMPELKKQIQKGIDFVANK